MRPSRRSARVPGVVCGCLLIPVLAALVWISRPCPPPLAGVPFSTLITDRDGRPLRLGLAADGRFRLYARLNELPSRAVRAVLRYEDRRFWSHPGVSLPDLARSALHMLGGGRRMGGSTLTMQVARLRLGLKTGTLTDKLRQMLWALRLEWSHSKETILEAYFNLAPYGGSVEGIGAAAAVYFHKEPRALSDSEILALIPVPQNPPARRPAPDNKAFFDAAARLQQAMDGERDKGVLTAAPSSLRVFRVRDLPMGAPHLATELLGTQPAGHVRTTIDAALQDLLERQVRAHAGRGRVLDLGNAAAMIVHWPSREVVAMTGSTDFFDRSIEGQNDGTACRRSPGSTLKPFIYALGLDQGRIHPRTLVADLPRTFAGYTPENFDGAFQGPLPADAALRLSRNVPAISLASRLELPDLYDFLRQAGVRLEHDREHYGLALVLGGAEVTMRELAALYCMLADGGVFRPLVWTLPRQGDGHGRRLLSPEAAWVTCDMLVSPDPDGAVVQPDGSFLPLRCKTGTSNGLRDAWTCGIVGPYVVCVWFGSFDNRSNPLLVGAGAALPLFRSISRALAARGPLPDPLARPAPSLHLARIPVCSETGDVDVSLCPEPHRQVDTWFLPGVSPVRDTGILRRVLVNRRTLLRSCTPDDDETDLRVMEFWPTEFAQSWARAGVIRPGPPAWEAGCGRFGAAAGAGPRIQEPRPGVTYYVPHGQRACRLPLLAHADAGVKAVYWFCGNDCLGTARPGQTIVRELLPGDHVLRAVDDTGGSSSLPLRVRRVP